MLGVSSFLLESSSITHTYNEPCSPINEENLIHQNQHSHGNLVASFVVALYRQLSRAISGRHVRGFAYWSCRECVASLPVVDVLSLSSSPHSSWVVHKNKDKTKALLVHQRGKTQLIVPLFLNIQGLVSLDPYQKEFWEFLRIFDVTIPKNLVKWLILLNLNPGFLISSCPFGLLDQFLPPFLGSLSVSALFWAPYRFVPPPPRAPWAPWSVLAPFSARSVLAPLGLHNQFLPPFLGFLIDLGPFLGSLVNSCSCGFSYTLALLGPADQLLPFWALWSVATLVGFDLLLPLWV